MATKRTKRPCRVCGGWFEPHARAVRQQVTCGPECSRERHRRMCEGWRRRNPDYDREERLRRRVRRPAEPPVEGDPRDGLVWPQMREAVGLKMAVVLDEALGMVVRWTREAVATRSAGRPALPPGMVPTSARDGIGEGQAPP